MKILIIKLGSFGDVIHALPVLIRLKEQYPEAQIDWLVSKNLQELLKEEKLINKLIPFEKNLSTIITIIKKLRKEKYDYVLDLQGLIKTGLLSKCLNANKVIGLSPARERIAEWFWNQRVKSTPVLEQKVHVIQRNLEILKAFNIADASKPPKLPFFSSAPQKPNFILNAPYMVFAPETRWESKNWPIEYWVTLINNLLNNEALKQQKIVLLGQTNLGEKIANSFVDEKRVINLVSKTKFDDLIRIVAHASFVLGGDSGILHLASAYNILNLGIFGPTSPTRTGPWKGNFIWQNIECSPCHKRKCKFEEDKKLECLKQIKPKQVEQEVLKILL